MADEPFTQLEKIRRAKILVKWEMKGFEDALDGKSLKALKRRPEAVAYFVGYYKARLIMAGH